MSTAVFKENILVTVLLGIYICADVEDTSKFYFYKKVFLNGWKTRSTEDIASHSLAKYVPYLQLTSSFLPSEKRNV